MEEEPESTMAGPVISFADLDAFEASGLGEMARKFVRDIRSEEDPISAWASFLDQVEDEEQAEDEE